MPNSHNGYYDTKLEMGYVGLAFLLAFILATLHAVGRVADRDPGRALLLLSLALFVILWNFFESIWMRGFEFLWVMFVIVAAEIARYWLPFPLGKAAYGSRRQRPVSSGPPAGAPPASEAVVTIRPGVGSVYKLMDAVVPTQVAIPASASPGLKRVDTCRCWTGCGAWPF